MQGFQFWNMQKTFPSVESKGDRILLQLCVAELAPLQQLAETQPAAPPTDDQSSYGHQSWGPYCSLSPQSSTCGLMDGKA